MLLMLSRRELKAGRRMKGRRSRASTAGQMLRVKVLSTVKFGQRFTDELELVKPL